MKRANDVLAAATLAIAAAAVAVALASTAGCASWSDKQRKGTGIGAALGAIRPITSKAF